MSEVKISAVIITFNEERNIERCLESIQEVSDEIVVVDSFSTDRTKEICERYSVHFVEHTFEGHIQQKNYAISLANEDWILSLDADEALSDELKQSIIEAKSKMDLGAYQMKRLTRFCGQWIKHTGWYPDKKVRLWKKGVGEWGGQNPHDRVILSNNAVVSQLSGDLLHYSFYSISEHVQQIQKFSSIAAESAFKNGKRANLLTNILIGPFYTFFKKYVLQAGFLDGYYGFIISVNTAYSKFLKYIKLREIQNRKEI